LQRLDRDIISSKSTREVTMYLRDVMGFNIVPIRYRTKVPDLSSLSEFFEKKCDLPISDNQSIAMLHGSVSGTFALDLDHRDIIHEIFNDSNLIRKSTIVVKTPKKGYHIIYKAKDGDYPPKNIKLFNKEGKEIDIRTQGGYTMLPPSIHDEVNGNYEFVSESLNLHSVRGSDILDVLEQFGYYEESVIRSKLKKETQNNYNNWLTEDLCKGGYTKGERRRKQNSYYVKLRKQGKAAEHASAEILRVNQTCKPEPLDSSEVTYNLGRIEEFYQSIKDNLNNCANDNEEKDPDQWADVIQCAYKFATIRDTEELLVYQNGVYVTDLECTTIKEECEKVIPKCSTRLCSEIINKIKRRTYTNRDKFDSSDSVLNLKNGLLNIRTLEFREHTPDYLSRIQIPVDYDPGIVPTKFLKYIRECLDNPEDIIRVMEGFATCLLRTTRFEKAYMFIGQGQNGKSTFLDVLQSVLGHENVSNVMIQELTNERFVNAELDNKLANIYPDIESFELRNTGVIKGLISGDRIKVERKNQHPYMMKNKAILFFSANKFPKVLDQSDAMFRRFFIIDWTRQFSGNRKDTQLKETLRNDSAEHSGILNILVRLARDLDSRGFYRHEQDIEELRDKWNKRADTIQQFYEDEVELDEEYFIEKGALFSDYVKYCTQNKLQRESERQFRKVIKDTTLLTDAFKRLEGRSARVWLGGNTRSRLRNGGQMSLDQ